MTMCFKIVYVMINSFESFFLNIHVIITLKVLKKWPHISDKCSCSFINIFRFLQNIEENNINQK